MTPENEEVLVPEEVVEEVQADPKIIEDAEKAVLNKKIAAVTGAFFRTLAKISDEEIYELAFTDKGQDSPLLLELVNSAFKDMIDAGGDLPKGHFDHYKKLISDFNNTIVFNIETKLEANRDTLIAIATGKTENPDRISHKDIIDALSK
jgi:hypothetical protein